MSDDFDFEGFETPYQPETPDAAPAPAPAPPPEPSPPAIDPNAFQAMQAEMQGLRQWKEDATRFFTGQQGQQSQGMTREQELEMFVKDPAGYRNMIREEMRQERQQERNVEAFRQEYLQKHPDLARFEKYLILDAQELMYQAQQSGQQMTDRQAMDAAIQNYRQEIASYSQQQQAGQQVRYMAMNPGTGQTAQPAGQAMTEQERARQIWNMPAEEFRKLDNARSGWNPALHE